MEETGRGLRARHLDANVKINMHSLFAVGADLPPDPRFKRELQELNPQERVSHTLYCPMAALWKEYGVMEIGRIYCEEFHRACYGHYAFGLHESKSGEDTRLSRKMNIVHLMWYFGRRHCRRNFGQYVLRSMIRNIQASEATGPGTG